MCLQLNSLSLVVPGVCQSAYRSLPRQVPVFSGHGCLPAFPRVPPDTALGIMTGTVVTGSDLDTAGCLVGSLSPGTAASPHVSYRKAGSQ